MVSEKLDMLYLTYKPVSFPKVRTCFFFCAWYNSCIAAIRFYAVFLAAFAATEKHGYIIPSPLRGYGIMVKQRWKKVIPGHL